MSSKRIRDRTTASKYYYSIRIRQSFQLQQILHSSVCSYAGKNMRRKLTPVRFVRSYAGDIQTVQRVLLAIGHLCEGFLATPDRKYRWPTLAWAALSHHVNSDTDARESIERIRSRFSRQTSETERLASVIGNASNPSSHLGAKSR